MIKQKSPDLQSYDTTKSPDLQSYDKTKSPELHLVFYGLVAHGALMALAFEASLDLEEPEGRCFSTWWCNTECAIFTRALLVSKPLGDLPTFIPIVGELGGGGGLNSGNIFVWDVIIPLQIKSQDQNSNQCLILL